MIEALCPQLEVHAEFRLSQVRNSWAHQADMDAALFQTYTNGINQLVAGMNSQRLLEWDKVDRMVAQWSC